MGIAFGIVAVMLATYAVLSNEKKETQPSDLLACVLSMAFLAASVLVLR